MDEKERMTLTAFLAPKNKVITDTKYVVSERFEDDGKPVEWILRPVTVRQEKEIKRLCILGGKFDDNKYIDLLIARSIVYPPLGNVGLQDSYHAQGETALLEKMLTGCEYSMLGAKVQEINGLLQGASQIVTEIKNG